MNGIVEHMKIKETIRGGCNCRPLVTSWLVPAMLAAAVSCAVAAAAYKCQVLAWA